MLVAPASVDNNGRHLQQVPGRKTDVSDADWIAQQRQYGLLERSFIPEDEQRDLRDLTSFACV